MDAGGSVRGSDENRPAGGEAGRVDDVAASDAPTPPAGFIAGGVRRRFQGDLAGELGPLPETPEPEQPGPEQPGPEELTPPAGIDGLRGAADPDGVVSGEDFGHAGPAVLGGADPVRYEPHSDAGDWPTLEYRSRSKPKRGGAFGWIRRRNTG